jgi:hypothetical protein
MSMKRVFVFAVFAIVVMASTGLLFVFNVNVKAPKATAPIYFGVTFCGNTTAEGKMLVDRVHSYTNLFIIDSGVLNNNETALTEVCDYSVNKGLPVIVFFGDLEFPWQLRWVNDTKTRLGDMFLGVYYYDEPGGIQLDFNWEHSSTGPLANLANATRNYDSAAANYTNYFHRYGKFQALRHLNITVFTSDYALYWWDYQAGFDVILTQLGWNQSITQQIDLSRAAANMQNKTWGAIITYKNTVPPYLDTADNIYSQMLQAYESGAKYIAIFNYPKYPDDNQYGILTDQDFDAIQNFWNHITSPTATSADPDYSQPNVALVLPRNYGFGLRDPLDRVWGYWSADELSFQVWNVTQVLVARYGLNLDIVYDDPTFPFAGRYTQVYLWNQTIAAMPQPIPVQPRFP